MKVGVATPRAEASRKMVFELLVADQPDARDRRTIPTRSSGTGPTRSASTTSRFPQRRAAGLDISHPAMAVNLDACIHCNLCVRACREVQVNDVIGMAGRGHHEQIVFDFDDPMGDSTCVACGECVQACPTGALMPSVLLDDAQTRTEYADRTVDSLCPYCGVGCQLTYHIKDDKILHVTGKDGPANQERLCVKGRFGFDYVNHPDRLTVPLIRKDGVPKSADDEVDPANPWTHFREATWEEALERAAAGLLEIRERKGGAGLAGFGSAKGSNEEAYLFQKLVRTGFGTNNVDHCTRLCHASSVAALFEGIGSGAVTAPFSAALDAETIFVIGANPTINHPVAATFIKNAVKRGAKLIVIDPRGQALSRHATINMRFKPGSDVALLNAMLHTIITEGLTDKQYIAGFTEGFAELVEKIGGFSPEAMEPVCGMPAETLRTVARMYARSRASIIFWGMGISQHVHGTDNARCLIALALVTGQVARPGTGLHPLRGQNNVQGASDAGLIPMFFPDYRPVESPAHDQFEKIWGTPLDPKRGLTVVEIMTAIHADQIEGMYIMGENPAMSDPDVHHARQALAKLEHLVVQDIFLTETAWHADVVLPASAFPEKDGTFTNTDRRVQLGRKALPLPGQARHDLDIILDLASRLGCGWSYEDVGEVFTEMAGTMPSLKNISWERLVNEGAVTYPADGPNEPGNEILFGAGFPTPSGRGKIVPAAVRPPDEMPDAEYPVGAVDRPRARALAHRRDDAALGRARRARARGDGPPVAARPRAAGHRARRHDPRLDPSRRDRAHGADRFGRAARHGLHPVLLRRGGGQPADQPGARPVRQDPRVQVLRRPGRAAQGDGRGGGVEMGLSSGRPHRERLARSCRLSERDARGPEDHHSPLEWRAFSQKSSSLRSGRRALGLGNGAAFRRLLRLRRQPFGHRRRPRHDLRARGAGRGHRAGAAAAVARAHPGRGHRRADRCARLRQLGRRRLRRALRRSRSGRPTTLRCVDRIAAGHDPAGALAPGIAARIFTGAILPEGADVVIMQEDCERDGDRVTIRPGIKRGANTRRAGEDVAHGARRADGGAAARSGRSRIAGGARLRRGAGAAQALGRAALDRRRGARARRAVAARQIHDANRYILAGLLERLGVDVSDRGIVRDDPARLNDALQRAAAESDLIITSGGVSTGEEDHVRTAIANHGSLYFWRLAIKPGRPVAMGQIGATPLAGLPGNPVAALLTFALVARPMIEALGGSHAVSSPSVSASSATSPTRRRPAGANMSAPRSRATRPAAITRKGRGC